MKKEEEGKNIIDDVEMLLKFMNKIFASEESLEVNKIMQTFYEKTEKIEIFLEEYLYNIILDDRLFSKEKQRRILQDIRNLLNSIKIYLRYPWIYGKVKIAFAGRYSSGKSSIINSFLGVDILPEGTNPTTTIPTYISSISLEIDQTYIVTLDGRIFPVDIAYLKSLNHEAFKGLGKVLQNIIDHIFINSTSPLLKRITIIDTPGYDSVLQSKDRDLSLKVANECNAIFWTIDIQDGEISRESLKILKNKINLKGKKLYFIINKVDKKPPSAVKKIRKHIENTLKKNNINYEKIILFS